MSCPRRALLSGLRPRPTAEFLQRNCAKLLLVLDAPEPIRSEDVLAQATRARLFSLLAELGRSAGTAELARSLELHPNGVRIHLERLEQAGLVSRARARHGRGRPADRWTIAPGARPGGEPPRAYRDLGQWLARSIGERSVSSGGLERCGREIGRELAPGDSDGGPEAVEQLLAALGFAPVVEADRGGRLSLRLCNCPYRDVVRDHAQTVCALHKGITRGMLDVLAPGAKLARFEPHDPDRAGCVVELIGS
jgi:predicted ArsR family transcriptional regulator